MLSHHSCRWTPPSPGSHVGFVDESELMRVGVLVISPWGLSRQATAKILCVYIYILYTWIIMDQHGLIMSYHPFSPVNYDPNRHFFRHFSPWLATRHWRHMEPQDSKGSAPVGAWLGSHSAVGGDDAGLKGTQQGCLKDADAWTGWTLMDILWSSMILPSERNFTGILEKFTSRNM